jgi:hypothetical protein
VSAILEQEREGGREEREGRGEREVKIPHKCVHFHAFNEMDSDIWVVLPRKQNHRRKPLQNGQAVI